MEAYGTTAVLNGDGRVAVDKSADQSRIRVLFLMIQMGAGGAERQVLNLVKKLDRRTFAPCVAWFADGHLRPEFEELQIPLYFTPKRKPFDWNAMRAVSRIIRDEGIDVVNAHHFMSFVYAYYGAKIANRAGIVYTEHSEADVFRASGKWRTIGRHLLRSCDALVGISQGVSRALASHFRVNPANVHTIENGVDVDGFVCTSEERRTLRARLGLTPDDVAIVQVANFFHNKNHLFLLKAFHELVRRGNPVKLIFVGQGFPSYPDNSEPDLRSYVRDNGLTHAVQFLGYRTDVAQLLGAMDIFCLVSHAEGLPLSLVEGMASGLPVIGTDIEAIRPLIDPGVNGYRVTPDDVPALAAALNRLVDDRALRLEMGEASRLRARTAYSLQRCVGETERLFLSVVSSGSMHASSPVPRSVAG